MVTTLTKGSDVQSIVGQAHYIPPGVREQEVYNITQVFPFIHSKSNHQEQAESQNVDNSVRQVVWILQN